MPGHVWVTTGDTGCGLSCGNFNLHFEMLFTGCNSLWPSECTSLSGLKGNAWCLVSREKSFVVGESP